MDSNNDLRNVLRKIINNFFTNNEISDDIKKVQISDIELNKICNELFSDIKKNNSSIINEDVKIDLELFEGLGNDKQNSIFSGINKCKTKLGSFLLKNILNNPTKNINTLLSRQNIIKKINSDSKIKKTIELSLDIIKKNEMDILYLWKELDEENQYLINMVFFQNRFLKIFNKNETVLKFYNFYVILFAPLHCILTPIVMVLAPFIFIKFYFKQEISLSLYLKLLKVAISGISNLMKFDPTKDNTTWSIGKMVSVLMWIIFYIHALYSNIQLAKTTNEIINILHQKINKISEYVKESHKLFDLIGKDLEKQGKIINYKVEKTFGILWDDTFTQKPSIMSNKGRILKTFKCLRDNNKNLVDLLKFVSTVDLYSGLSNLYSDGDYCFPTYSTKVNPHILIKDLWYPILKKKIVKNNIEIGENNPLNAIITGPNAGGKSTFIKSLTLNIIFAQTFGICPSGEFKMTPFSLINTYLNIPDCKGKESLFEAEMRRSLEHIKSLDKIEKNNHSFVIMDEIFSSTNPNEGISGAYAIADKLSKYKNNICLITSHYSYLTNLEKEGKFKNYKIPISRDKANNIVYNYKLVQGISNQFIALELLEKKGFDKEIIKKAQKINNEISENIERVRPKRKLKKKFKITNKLKDTKINNNNKLKDTKINNNNKLKDTKINNNNKLKDTKINNNNKLKDTKINNNNKLHP